MTDDATDGRPWPIDPIITSPSGPLPVPDLVVADEASDISATFADSLNGGGPAAEKGAPPLAQGSTTVSDEDRTAYGVLLDRAAERGLLSQYDYQVRLGDLAAATSIDQMQQIVTELPVFEAQASPTAPRRSRSATGVAAPAGAALRGSRTSPWLLLAIVVALAVVSLVFLAVYARHVGHSQGGAPVLPAPTRFVSGPRL